MTTEPVPSQPALTPRKRRLRWRLALLGLILLVFWALVAYIAAPLGWVWYAHRHPTLDDVPGITQTGNDIPGDPINVALIGSENDLKALLLRAGWYPANPLTLRSCLEIAADTVLKRTYNEAPVSNLYLFGRKEDLAFEQPVGDNPRQRHHVRFWRTEKIDPDGRPVWVGGATYDERVGFSHTTGQITHHIAADVDAERDHLFQTLQQTGDLTETYFIDNFHKVREGRNGGGDPWRTDGRLLVGVILVPDLGGKEALKKEGN